MVDAVGSVISSIPLSRGTSVEQQNSQSASVVTESRDVGVSAAPQAPFISLVVAVDDQFDEAVFQVRNPDNGDILRQFPTESSLRARQSADAFAAQAQVNATAQQGTETVADTAGTVPDAPPVDIGQAQQAAAALSTAAATQTSEAGQATVSVTA